ncbi:MAG: RNA methyltransferase [Spirochaetia bacterium]
MNSLDSIKIILVNPNSSGNIGAVCRAMKTMGIKKLAVTGSAQYDEKEIRYRSVHAFEIYENAERPSSLEEALAGTVYSAGTTRRKGAKRKYHSILPEDLAERISRYTEGISAVVFGNEEHGLTSQELALCSEAVNIPSSPEFPSLNLSHAVQVITYTLYRHTVPAGGYNPVTTDRISEVAGRAVECLNEIGYFGPSGQDDMEIFLRDLFVRAALDRKEADRIESLIFNIRGMVKR